MLIQYILYNKDTCNVDYSNNYYSNNGYCKNDYSNNDYSNIDYSNNDDCNNDNHYDNSCDRRTILKDWDDKCIVATKQRRGAQRDTLYQPQNINSLRDKRDNIVHMVFEGEPAVKLHDKNIEVGTSANENPRQDQVTMGRVHSPDLLTTIVLVLFLFSIMHQ